MIAKGLPLFTVSHHSRNVPFFFTYVCLVWQLVDNAVFDVKWRPYYLNQAVASSGSWSVHLIDVPTRETIANLSGHTASVRTSSFAPQSSGNTLASGGRDGTIRIWDLRQGKAVHVIQVDQAKGVPLEPFGVASPRTRTGLISSPARAIIPSSEIKRRKNAASVVGLGFLDPSTLVSCSDKQGLALWDLRYAHGGRRLRLDELDQSRGLVHIATDSKSRRVSVLSCTNSLYVIDVDTPRVDAILQGTNVSSFYIQSAFSPDGSMLVAGSADKVAPIWSLRNFGKNLYNPPEIQPFSVLDADDAGEVSVVAWNPCYPDIISTASDSFCIRIWRARRHIDVNDQIMGRSKPPPEREVDEYRCFSSPVPWHRVVRRDPAVIHIPSTPPVTPQTDSENLIPNRYSLDPTSPINILMFILQKRTCYYA